MNDLMPEVKGELDSLRALLTCDVTAAAWIHPRHHSFHWHYISGNRSNRYQRISFKTGHGLPGMAIRLGRSIETNPLLTDTYHLRQDCALMLAEQLCSAFAAPIFNEDNMPKGVLLVGQRHTYRFIPHDTALIEQSSRRLGALKFK